jgi:hypothetical protein
MEQDLRREARSALIGAAERLGVDPFRLARFLSDGRLADILTRLRISGGPERDSAGSSVDLAERYLEFLDQEIATRGSGPATGDGSGRPRI